MFVKIVCNTDITILETMNTILGITLALLLDNEIAHTP